MSAAELAVCSEQNAKLKEIILEFPNRCSQQAREYYSNMHTAWDFVMSAVALAALGMLGWQRYQVQLRMYWTRLKLVFSDPPNPHAHNEDCGHTDEAVHEVVRQRFKDQPEVE